MNKVAAKMWHIIELICHTVLKIGFHILNRELTDEKEAVFLQFIKFVMVGLSNTIIWYVLYLFSLLVFKALNILPNSNYLVAQIIGFVLSVLWSFYWNNRVVFTTTQEQTRVWWKALLKTYISYSFTGLFLNSILIVFWVQVCHISEYVAPVINLLISVPLNFVINKLWTFRSD